MFTVEPSLDDIYEALSGLGLDPSATLDAAKTIHDLYHPHIVELKEDIILAAQSGFYVP